jgi:hypothetical protein
LVLDFDNAPDESLDYPIFLVYKEREAPLDLEKGL